MNLEEGCVNSITERLQRGSVSGAKIKSMKELTKSFYDIVTKLYRILIKIIIYIVELYYPKGPLGYSVFLAWSMWSMFMDPLFLYIPLINDNKKCFKLDIPLMHMAIFYRSTYDFLYVSNFIRNMRSNSDQNAKRKWVILLFDLFIVLPLPQVLVILVSCETIRAQKLFFGMNFFLFQHALKVIRLYTWFQKAKTEGSLVTWAKFAFNLSFLHAGNLFGAIWYFFAVERQTVCWRKACRNHNNCDHHPFYCNDQSSGNYTISIDFCSTSTQNRNTYDFGIFLGAIQSGVVEGKGFFQRFIPSFRWGLQNVSWFGQGLPFSANLPENLFVMSITVSGVVLFFFLIGKVQMHVQSETVKLEETKQKLKALEQWQPLRNLPQELQNQVKKYQSQNWPETRGFDVEYLVHNLPEDLRKEIKRKPCLDLIKKVEEFGNWSDALLEDLCHLAKPVFYRERSYIVQEGDPIDQILFLLQGNLWTYISNTITESSSTNYQKDIDFCGVELVSWAQDETTNHLPVSTRTIQALTNVEAFVLIADDLKKGIQLIIKKDRSARLIQLFWRSRRNA